MLRYAGLVVAVFGVVGVGLGSTGYIGMSAAGDALMSGPDDSFGAAFVAIVFLQSMLVSFFAGPSVAAVTGVASAIAIDDPRTAVGANTIGSFVGFLLMALIAVVIMASAVPETGGSTGGGGGQLSASDFSMLAKAAFPTTLVGAGVAWISTRVFE